MRILLIGNSGFIGSHLAPALVEAGHQVVGMDRNRPADDNALSQFHLGDIRNHDDLVKALPDIDCVINLAAVHFDFGHTDDEYWDTNQKGTETLLAAMDQCGVRRLVFTSSIAVYGDRTDEASEQTSPHPTSVYGASKLGAEEAIRKWMDQNNTQSDDQAPHVVILRPCVVYGERNVTNMLNLIRQIHSGYFVLFGKGTNVKATAYVGNLVAAIIHQLERMDAGLKLFNYADKPDLTVRQIVGIIRESLGKQPKPIQLPMWLGMLAAVPFEVVTRLTGKNLPVSMARVRKLAQPTCVEAQRIRDAGFEQPTTSEEGLRRMVEHFQHT